MSDPNEQGKIVVVRKKGSGEHDGHHGGAWKVAYADFVTAMMAFFLVMWIMGMDEGVKDMVQGYFSNPLGFEKRFSGGTNPLAAGNAPVNFEQWKTVLLKRRAQHRRFQALARRMEEDLDASGVMRGLPADVEIVVTEEGLRVELMETGEEQIFFERSSVELKPALEKVLRVLATALQDIATSMVVEGHTDSLTYSGEGFTNWELSVARANAARRILRAAGLPEERISEVRGYADGQPKVAGDPANALNRRITLLLPYSADLPAPGPNPASGTDGVTGSVTVAPSPLDDAGGEKP